MNNQESGTTEYGPDTVPSVEVIRVEINPDAFDEIKRQIAEQLPDLADLVREVPLDIFSALPGNRVIQVSPVGEKTFVPGPNDKFMPQSLIPIALFVGKGSNISCCTVGSNTRHRNWG